MIDQPLRFDPAPVDELAPVGCRRDVVAHNVEEEPLLHLTPPATLASVHLYHRCRPLVRHPLPPLDRPAHITPAQTVLLLQLPPRRRQGLLSPVHPALRQLPATSDVHPLERQHLTPVRMPHHYHDPRPEV